MKIKGFTLIELIVVMGILAILATIVVIAVNPARQFAASRNAKRSSDTRAITEALNQYAANNNGIVYSGITTTPQNIGTSNLDLTATLVPSYLSAIPKDPSSGTDADTKYIVFKDAMDRVSVVASLSEMGRTIGYGATPNIAAQFTPANAEYLTVAHNATLTTGDIDYWIAGWTYLDSKAAYRNFAGKWGSAGNSAQLEYNIRYDVTSDRFEFNVSNGTTITTIEATTFGSPQLNTWYFVIGYHDATTNVIKISVNGGAYDSVSYTSGTQSYGAGFSLGRPGDYAGDYMAGRLDNWAFGKNPVGGINAVANALRDSLYNSGRGKPYSEITSQEKTTWGLISWWNLDEASGTRNDAHGTNHVSDNNTVTDAPGI